MLNKELNNVDEKRKKKRIISLVLKSYKDFKLISEVKHLSPSV